MTNEELAAVVKAWRGKTLSARKAAMVFDIPQRTWQHMEQGRGFPYPTLLLMALASTRPPEEGQNGNAS